MKSEIPSLGLKLPNSLRKSIFFFKNDTFESVQIKRGKLDRLLTKTTFLTNG